MRITLIAKPSSPDALLLLQEAVAELRSAGHVVTPRVTFDAGDARTFAREAAIGGAELVLAAGGDGTVNQVAAGIHAARVDRAVGVAAAAPRVPRLGIVPVGTANDLAGELGIPGDVRDAVLTAVAGRPLPIDVGMVNGCPFLNVSTGGLGAEATEEAAVEVKRVLGPLAYFVTGVKKFVALNTSHARFTGAGASLYEGPFLIFAVGNSRRTGGGNRLTPRADPGDGLLDVCIVREIPRRDLLTLLPDLRAGRHLEHPAVVYRQVPELCVESEEELSVNVDGEPLGGRILRYTLSPHRLEVAVP